MFWKPAKYVIVVVLLCVCTPISQAQQAISIELLRVDISALQKKLSDSLSRCPDVPRGTAIPGMCIGADKDQIDLRSRLALMKADLALLIIGEKK